MHRGFDAVLEVVAGTAGISSLLNGHKLFDAQWQSMSIDVRPVCDVDGECRLQLAQTVDMVLDIQRSLNQSGFEAAAG